MKTTIRISMILLALITAIMTQSCLKEGFKKKVKPSDVAKDNAIAEKSFSDLNNQVKAVMFQAQNDTENGKGMNLLNNTCATITVTPYDWTTFPKTIEIDYGTGCPGDDGILRKGKVIIHTTGWYRVQGTIITVTPDSFYVNEVLVEGTQVITNNGTNSNNNITYTVNTNGSVTTPEGTINWTSNFVSEWIAGEPTQINLWDDEYLVTGTQHGITVHGDEYDILITTPLHIKTNCGFIVAGELVMTASGFQDDIFVNYGTGDCDNIIVVTYLGQNYTIVMQ